MNQPKTPAFKKLIGDISDNLVLVPLIQSYLHNNEFRGITLEIEAEDSHSLAKGPDGWFHPSTHVLWPERLLWFYLNEPDHMIFEPLGYMGQLNVTIGKVLHAFIQEALDDLGVMIAPTRKKPEEPQAIDPKTRSRGHYDGELNLFVPKYPDIPRQLFEYKTRTPLAKMVPHNDIEGFKAKHPAYYAQIQDYMRMTGLRLAIVLMMQTGHPWNMWEYQIPYDPIFAGSLAKKYLSVLAASESGDMPPPCCAPGSKESKACPARGICPIARMK